MSEDEIAIDGTPVFDLDDRPPAGTACVRCRSLFQHFCPAKGYRGEQALCLSCGEGRTCEQTAAVLRMEAGAGAFDAYETDPRGLPSPGRAIEITPELREADRMAAAVSRAAGWEAKASLSAANLGPRVKVPQPRPDRIAVPVGRVRVRSAKQVERERLALLKRERRLEQERRAGRKRRMEELAAEGVKGDAAVMAAAAETGSGAGIETRLCTKVAGCDRPHGHSGRHRRPGVPSKPAKLKVKVTARGLTLRAGGQKQVVKPEPLIEQAAEFIAVRVPVTAMDRLFAMMPSAIKGAAVEKLLAELGSTAAGAGK